MPEVQLNKKCDECGNMCIPLPCANNLESSEFHCLNCNKSYRMDIEVAKHILVAEARMRQGK